VPVPGLAQRRVRGGDARRWAGIWLGHGDLNRTVFAVLICLLVSFRLVTLALRDWRLPIPAEVGWFALALGSR
jgi:hypothetical protein